MTMNIQLLFDILRTVHRDTFV